MRSACDALPGARPAREGFSLGQLVVAMTGLICVGKPAFDAIEEQREQPFFAQALGLPSCPSAPTLRQRLQAAEGDAGCCGPPSFAGSGRPNGPTYHGRFDATPWRTGAA